MDKKNLIFLDTETTGTEENDRLCQVAYKFNGEEVEALFKPPVPISVDAMAVAHITNKMVNDKEPFIGSKMEKELKKILADEKNIFIAHNAKFDVAMLKREDVEVKSIIDTYKIAQYWDKDAVVPKYNLQYLRYYFELEVGKVVAHDALGDVVVLEKLFEHLFNLMFKEIGDEGKVLEEMLEVSKKPIMIKTMNFGKHKGEKVVDVAQNDPQYLEWLLNQKIQTRDQGGINDEDWIFTLEQCLEAYCR